MSQICPGLVNTEFSTIRFRGDKDKANDVYKGLQPLVGQDIGKILEKKKKKKKALYKLFFIAELVTFTASRPSHVNICDMLGKLKQDMNGQELTFFIVFPTSQADAKTVHRSIK